MKNICKNCKFCDGREIITKVNKYRTGKYKYFCKLMPSEVEVKEDNWCGQFKPKFNNEDHNEAN